MKPSEQSKSQLKICFDDNNPLAARLRGGHFSCLLELDTPLLGQPLPTAAAMSVILAKRVAGIPWVAGLVVSDRHFGEQSHDPVAMASLLGEASGKPIVMTISGKGSSRSRIRDLAARAHSEGVRTILAVTGDISDQHPRGRSFLHPAPHPAGYADSVETIGCILGNQPRTLVGGAVNPYKYNLSDQYLQYAKMLRKVATGAAYLTTHFGWDMKKLQELKWFLQMREAEVPVIARLAVLSRSRIQQLHGGFHPGVPLSRPFTAILQREAEISEAQSMAAQLRRLSLQAAGCRLLGFSGIQVGGIQNEQTLEQVLKAIANPPQAAVNYAEWVKAWRDHHADADFAPVPRAYYMFKKLMQPDQSEYDPDSTQLTEGDFPRPNRRDYIRWRTLELIGRHRLPGFVRTKVRHRFCQNCEEHFDNTDKWFHLCPRACPKRLVLGPCGGSQADGSCEFSHDPCFHHRILALAAAKNRIHQLEEEVGEA